MRHESIDLDPGPGVSSEAQQYPWFATPAEVRVSLDRAIRQIQRGPDDSRDGRSSASEQALR